MKIKDAIEQLQKHDPEEELIIGWWDRSSFENELDVVEWGSLLDAEFDYDWSSTHESLTNFAKLKSY